MKRILCLILALLLLTPAAFANEDMIFTMSSVSGKMGETVTVVGSVKNAPVCAAYQVIFTYDDKVLEVVEGKNIDSKGTFLINTDTSNGGKKAVNVLSAHADKVLEGDVDLFQVTFKIIGKPADENGTLLEMVKNDFVHTDLTTNLYPTVEPAHITLATEEDTPPAPDADTPSTEEKPDTNETPSTGEQGDGEAESDNNETVGTTPNENKNDKEDKEDKKENDKKPTGSWLIDEENDEVHHITEDGESTLYVPEYTEKPEEGKVTEIILKDEEGKDAGSIKVEKQENGELEVVEQDLNTAKKGFPAWGWAICIVAAVVIAGGAVVLVLKNRREEKEDGEELEDDEE